jgi:hypothetical protein
MQFTSVFPDLNLPQESALDIPPSAQNPSRCRIHIRGSRWSASGNMKAPHLCTKGRDRWRSLGQRNNCALFATDGMQYASLFGMGAPLAANGDGIANAYGRSFESYRDWASAGRIQTVACFDCVTCKVTPAQTIKRRV